MNVQKKQQWRTLCGHRKEVCTVYKWNKGTKKSISLRNIGTLRDSQILCHTDRPEMKIKLDQPTLLGPTMIKCLKRHFPVTDHFAESHWSNLYNVI